MISDSLSFGIREAVEKGCDQKVLFVAGICVNTDEEFRGVLATYRTIYWRNNPEVCENAAIAAWEEGRILTPRAAGLEPPKLYNVKVIFGDFEEWRDAMAQKVAKGDYGVTEEAVLKCKRAWDVCELFPAPRRG